MRRFLLVLACIAMPISVFAKSAQPISRRDGFLMLWQSLGRTAQPMKSAYDDVQKGDKGYTEISYAKSRNILGDYPAFRPNDPLTLADGLTWLLRTRNIDDPQSIMPDTLSGYLAHYPIAKTPTPAQATEVVTSDVLQYLEENLDKQLRDEVHEGSLYAEKWQGQGTAFGETFDMNMLTAAHRTFPYNTLVRVTNVENGKSVVVRINDRGPYVKGRDIDLSLASFTTIAERGKGIVHVTFQRLGNVDFVSGCDPTMRKFQTRLSRTQRLNPGIPWFLPLGETLSEKSPNGFALRSIQYPDGTLTLAQDWITKDQTYTFKPSVTGVYTLLFSSLDGINRRFTMSVIECKATNEQ